MHRHVKLALGIVLGLGATHLASAADLAVKAPPIISAPLYNWTGCYVGVNGGGGWDSMHTVRDQIVGFPPTPAYLDMGTEHDSGFLGGVQSGCDFQTTRLVFGVQGMADWGNIKGSQNTIQARPGFIEQNKINDLFPVTGRFGFLVTPQFLVYGKLGFAWFNDRNSYYAGGLLFESTKWTDPMITAGIGFEYMFAPHWSVFVEGNYYWAEADDSAHTYVSPAGLPLETINSRPRIATGLVGVNYKFNWDNGPVVAKY
jgi:outer membrane immunogenic protein